MSIYQLKQDADNCVIVYNAMGDQVIKLEGGFSEIIVMSYLNMCNQGEFRGDDYMAGVIAGITHMHMLAPGVFNPLPPIPPIGPSI